MLSNTRLLSINVSVAYCPGFRKLRCTGQEKKHNMIVDAQLSNLETVTKGNCHSCQKIKVTK